MISMKTVVAAAVALPLLMGAGDAFASLKIAIVRSSDLVQNSPQYLAAQESIKTEFDKRKSELEAKDKKLTADIQTFQKNADVMSPDDREQQQDALLTRKNDLTYQENKFQQDLQAAEHDKTKQLMDQIQSVVNSVARKDGYALVLQDPVYAASRLDITDEVLKRLKSESGGK